MGCWNGTCGISFLPILYGDPVVCFIVREKHLQKDYGGGVKSTPMGFPIRGDYNDYGSIENIVENSITADYLKEFNTKLNKNKLDYDKDDFDELQFETIDEVLDICERGAKEEDYGGRVKYRLFMIHAGLYDMLIGDITDDMRKFAEYNIRYSSENKMNLARYKAIIEELGDRSLLNPSVFPIGYPDITEEEKAWADENTIGVFDGKVFWVESIMEEYHLKHKLMCKPMNEYLDDLIKLAKLKFEMSHLRRSFIHPDGDGSQDQEYEYYEKLIAWESQYIVEQKKKFED